MVTVGIGFDFWDRPSCGGPVASGTVGRPPRSTSVRSLPAASCVEELQSPVRRSRCVAGILGAAARPGAISGRSPSTTQPHTVARTLRARDDRGFGLPHAGGGDSQRLGPRDRRRRSHWFRGRHVRRPDPLHRSTRRPQPRRMPRGGRQEILEGTDGCRPRRPLRRCSVRTPTPRWRRGRASRRIRGASSPPQPITRHRKQSDHVHVLWVVPLELSSV